MIRAKVVKVEIAFINCSLGYDEWIKNRLVGKSGRIGDGNSGGWVDLNFVWTLFDLRGFRCVTVKTSLLMQICIAIFSNASVSRVFFFQLSHYGKSFCTSMIFSVSILYRTKQIWKYFFYSSGNEVFLTMKRIHVHVITYGPFIRFSSMNVNVLLSHIKDRT